MSNFNELFNKLNVRMHRKQKKEFRQYINQKATEMNYDCKIEKSSVAKNIVVGDINKAKYVFTAHYDTPPKLPKFFVKHMMLYSIVFSLMLIGLIYAVPVIGFELTKSIILLNKLIKYTSLTAGATLIYSIMHIMGFAGNANKTNFNDNTSGCYTLLKLMEKYQNLPKNERDQIAFVFFDNEEKFLLGSYTHKFKNKHNYKNKTYINLDCVGLGKQMNLYYFGKKPEIVNQLEQQINENNLFIPYPKKSNMMSMSDHYPLRKANHVCMLSVDPENNKSIFSQIHSSNDNKIDFTNIDNIVETIDNLPFIKDLKQLKYESLKNLHQHNKIKTQENELSINTVKQNSNEYTL